MRGDGGDEVFGAGAGGLDVFCADLEDFFEVDGNVCQFTLEEDNDLSTRVFQMSAGFFQGGEPGQKERTFLLCSPS